MNSIRKSDNRLDSTPLVQVDQLKKHFVTSTTIWGKTEQVLKAVDGVSFHINRRETFGLVGESGSGKSTVGRCLLRLYDYTDGEVYYDGQNISRMSAKQLKPFRRRIQSIFQDPYSSLNPGMNVAELISEPMNIHRMHTGKDRKEAIVDLLEKVGLQSGHLYRYPHEFSGGQRQRLSIARALSVNPEFIVCDEPISALDVSIQAQVINTLEDLQTELGLTYLFIAHDLSMVHHISDRIGVMYGGRLVEVADSDELYNNPLHPYTQALLSSIPIADPRAVIQPISYTPSVVDPNEAVQAYLLREVSPRHYVSNL
ncbi:ATP-binding cassette domain-containing protein [Paenibacillus sp. PsM32]|uniref:ABC transporter ATP-binding protein n=1 Tax=Paenibacillus sp. PsM32 TaxID=3030536 RepID=UPI00263B3803|nr:ATP-binding cassette domain-containing protein [Paenibacillus sp. PsM32]MDN4616653.1 ATP-binding cassette domain-containing protein [Paenibacillus sp. PsM32]